jgi:hypothetical protein
VKFAVGNRAALRVSPAVEAAILQALRNTDPDATWRGSRPSRERARQHPGDVAYTWLVRQLCGVFPRAVEQMQILRAIRRLQDRRLIRLTFYMAGRIGSVRLLEILPTNGTVNLDNLSGQPGQAIRTTDRTTTPLFRGGVSVRMSEPGATEGQP